MIELDTGQPMTKSLPEARKLKKLYRVLIQNDPCAYCGWTPKNDEARKRPGQTIDHIIPKSKEKHKKHLTPKQHEERGWQNWTGSCANCNGAKKDLDLLTFLLKEDRPTSGACPEKEQERRNGIRTRLNLLH